MSETNARAVGPFTEDDERRGEAIVQALHGIRGYDAWTIYIAQQLAAERRAALSAPVPSEEELERACEAYWNAGVVMLSWKEECEEQREVVRLRMKHVLALYPRSVPAGWQLVPKEPTEEMLCAARDWSVKKYGIGVGNDGATGCYRAMLSVAPPPKREV